MAKVRGHFARASLLFTEIRIACTLLPKGGSLMGPIEPASLLEAASTVLRSPHREENNEYGSCNAAG